MRDKGDVAGLPQSGNFRKGKIIWPLWNALKCSFSVDLRSLAAFRILIGIAGIIDLYHRFGDIPYLYSDDGAFPRSLAIESYIGPNRFCIHLMTGDVWLTQCLFIVHIGFNLALALGYKTRLSAVASWALAVSLQLRTVSVNHGGDQLHRCLLFFAIFAPIGERWSLDTALSKFPEKREKEHRTHRLSAMALVGQLCVMYVCSHYHKTGKPWTEHGSSAWMALQLDFYRTVIGDVLLHFPRVLRLCTFGVHLWQFWGMVLWFCPFYSDYFKLFSAIGFIFMHVGFGTCLSLGHFTTVSTAAAFVLLPGIFWDEIAMLLRSGKSGPRIANLLVHLRSKSPTAIQPLFGRLAIFFLSLGNFRTVEPVPSRDKDSDDDEQPVRTVKRRKKRHTTVRTVRVATDLVAAFFLMMIVAWTHDVFVPYDSMKVFPDVLLPLASVVDLEQRWNMFSPHPPSTYRWPIISGTLDNGREADLFEDGALFTAKPNPWGSPQFPDISGKSIPSHRWFKYFEVYTNEITEITDYRLEFGRWVCRMFNRDGNVVHKFTVYVSWSSLIQSDITQLPPLNRQHLGRLALWNHICYYRDTDE